MQIIDPHLHLFDLRLGRYDWLKPNFPPNWPDKHLICRDFASEDLTLPSPIQLAGFVHLEAGFDNSHPWREIEWLESSVNLPFRSVAFADLTLPAAEFDALLHTLTQYSSVVGIRHILDEQAQALLSNPQVIRNLKQLAAKELHFEVQLSGGDLQAINHLVQIADENPSLVLVINHAAFPSPDNWQHWLQATELMAACSNIVIKASGWEMTDRQYELTFAVQVMNQLIACFGKQRVMLASNFPLCLLSKDYDELWQEYTMLSVDADTLAALVHDNAKRIYRFD
ncbi:amidohydrolase family protein [Shewanella corallii]|uniref:Amidohydrolase family protein n=1 Tax=Shewanella corallii TaxID=560080 RepID=A0ABT0NAD6_9GAMM|nr:amidohydrolase family protein [Shewanella corallii]MCL2915417.1 amidohydrolase family protein [Shewanella corallii]